MKRTALFFALILSSFLCIYAGPKNSGNTKVTVTVNCIGTLDENTLDLSVQYSNKHDEQKFKELVTSGYAIILQKGTRATVVKRKIGRLRIKLPDGRMVWVLSKNVK